MEAAERRYLRLADRVLAVSETDRDAFAAFLSAEKLTVIPTGVDVEYFQPLAGEELPNSLVFTGSMDWLPNEDAILYFADAILPLIREHSPEVFLDVVGRNPSRKLQALAESEKSIRLTGWVDDIRPFLGRGSVCIVPLRIGGGTRLKIYEAMAAGKAIVSTSVGAEGLDVHHGRDIALADEPRAFAEAILMLLENTDVRKRYERAAADLAARYDWSAVAAGFEEVLERVARQAALRSAEYVPARRVAWQSSED